MAVLSTLGNRIRFESSSEETESELSTLRMQLRAQAAARRNEARLEFARAVTATTVLEFWNALNRTTSGIAFRLPPAPIADVSDSVLMLFGTRAARLPVSQAFYEIGELYTALLPDDYRTRFGIYYTPPSLVERLLRALEDEGADWGTMRVLDPACGGAAFAAFVAQRMLAANEHLSPESRLRDVKDRLVGIELDEFAAWLAEVFLDVVCLPLVRTSGRRIEGLIRTGDTLLQSESELGEFDLIVGNPPYGRVRLPEDQRQRFKRSLFGHANIYGVFTDLAVRHTRLDGLIGFVTPTSFLGGEYFKNLRRLLLQEAPPVHVTFIADRDGVFSNVLQETMAVVFRRGVERDQTSSSQRTVTVAVMQPKSDAPSSIKSLGRIKLAAQWTGPWILPRDGNQSRLIRSMTEMPARLADYGYRIATGQLVWNRHKQQFRDAPGEYCFPVLWAECIKSDGAFEFTAKNRNHRPFIRVELDQDYLINCEPCILVQRTTSKEQSRRLIAGVVPNQFVIDYPGYVVENHLNMLIPTSPAAMRLALVCRMLNTEVLDQAFRCISGSVAVSAYELGSLPLPAPDRLSRWMQTKRIKLEGARFDDLFADFYRRGGKL